MSTAEQIAMFPPDPPLRARLACGFSAMKERVRDDDWRQWFAVPLDILEKMKIARKISSRSRTDGATVYLEMSNGVDDFRIFAYRWRELTGLDFDDLWEMTEQGTDPFTKQIFGLPKYNRRRGAATPHGKDARP